MHCRRGCQLGELSKTIEIIICKSLSTKKEERKECSQEPNLFVIQSFYFPDNKFCQINASTNMPRKRTPPRRRKCSLREWIAVVLKTRYCLTQWEMTFPRARKMPRRRKDLEWFDRNQWGQWPQCAHELEEQRICCETSLNATNVWIAKVTVERTEKKTSNKNLTISEMW